MKKYLIIIALLFIITGCENGIKGGDTDDRDDRIIDVGNTEMQQKCENAGGEWRLFPNGCVDSCELARQDPSDPIGCTEAEKMGCDCGADKCWNGNSCEPN